MKRACLFLLIALLLILLHSPSLAEGSLNQICADGEHIYRLMDDVLWLADETLEPTQQIHAFEQPVEALCLSGGAFYFACREEGGLRFARLDEDGAVESLFLVQLDAPIALMAVYRDSVLVQWEAPADAELPHNRPVSAYAMDGSERKLPFAEASGLAVTEPYGLLIGYESDSGESSLYSCDAETGEYRKWEAESITYDLVASPDGQTVYVRDYANLSELRQEGERFTASAFAYWSEESTDVALACTGDRLYAYFRHGALNAQSWPLNSQANSAKQLTLVNCDNLFDHSMEVAVEQFQKLHPDVSLNFETIPRDQLNAALMANDGSIDLFLLDDHIRDMVSAGAILDLNQDDSLRATLESWVGGQLGCWQGVRVGVPVSIYANVLSLDPQLAQYKPDLDTQDCTWMDFLQAVERFSGDTDGDGRADMALLGDSLRFPMWMEQYIASFDAPEAVRFDTEEFRQLAERYRACVQAGQIADLYSEGEALPTLYNAGTIGLRNTPFLSDMAHEFCVPKVGDSAFATAQIGALAVCSGTAHPDWAFDFLMAYVSEEAQYDAYNVGPLPDRSLYPGYAEASDADRALLAQADGILNQARPRWDDLEFTLYCGDQTEAYMKGQISLDEWIQNLQQKLNMVLMG